MRSITFIKILTNSLFVIFFVTTVSAEDFGVHGKTYTIIEPDALSEVEARAQAVDWAKVISKAALTKKIIAYKPKDLKKLPTTRENKTRRVEMTYTLPSDIKDSNNVVVYPKGYQFNPWIIFHCRLFWFS